MRRGYKTHLMRHLLLHTSLRTCSADTILGAKEEPTREKTTYISASSRSYDFNNPYKMNNLLANALLATGHIKPRQKCDFDVTDQFIETKKYDTRPTYKKFLKHYSGMLVIGDMVIGNKTKIATTCTSTKKRLWNESSSGWRHRECMLLVPAWIAARARKRLWEWWRLIASIFISAPTGALPSTTPCLP